MESSLQIGATRSAFLARNWLAAGLILSLVANLILALWVAGSRSEIVLIPTHMSAEQYRLVGGTASEEYLADLAATVTFFLLNQTPGSSEASRERFLRLLHPAAFGEFSGLWDRTTQDLRERDISTAFYPLVLRSDKEQMSVELEGQFITFLGQSRTEERRTYVVSFSNDTGPFLLTDFYEKGQADD